MDCCVLQQIECCVPHQEGCCVLLQTPSLMLQQKNGRRTAVPLRQHMVCLQQPTTVLLLQHTAVHLLHTAHPLPCLNELLLLSAHPGLFFTATQELLV